MSDVTEGPETKRPASSSPPKGLLAFLKQHVDVEMWRKGWWMLALIIGTILIEFTISTIMVSQYPAPPAP